MLERARSLWRRLLHGRAPHAGGGISGAEERRVRVRHAADRAVRCGPAASGEGESALPASVLDISESGARLIVGREFRSGEVIAVEVPASDGLAGRAVLAVVVHASRRPGRQWVLGCRFSRDLGQDDLRAFGLKRERHAEVEGGARNDLGAVYRLSSPNDPSPRPAQVVNLCAGGVALRVERDVLVGTLLSVTVTGPSGRAAPEMLACVVHAVVEADDRHILGCDFIRDLRDEELREVLGEEG